MAELQTSYTETVAAGYPGMIANGETGNRISRTCETAAGIGFGKAVFRGAGDHGCLLAQALTGAGSAKSGNVGTSTITASPAATDGAQIGRYTITQLATSATGALEVQAPDGTVVGHGVVGTAITTIPGITTFTVTSGGTATIGDQFFIDVTGNALLGIAVAVAGLPLTSGQTADKYQQYESVTVLTRGAPIWVTLGGTVNDGDPVGIDSSGDFVTGSGIPMPGWIFDTTGVDDALAKIVRR